ncbi:hypothetical protein N7G274_006342 [Stereocaulon virgatum]|uniref:DUF7730 domain-containing protein n=1 Tax=Stereocaulon virgatum TaxID=373712 RepID=A0ABR4A5X0_9LECA
MPREERLVRAPAKLFPLLRLPPELRIRVWRYSLVKDTTIPVSRHQCRKSAGKPPPTLPRSGKRLEFHHQRQNLAEELPPTTLRSGKRLELGKWPDPGNAKRCKKPRTISRLALALTCQQIYLEATPIYYAENTFSFNSAGYGSIPGRNALMAFVDAIGTVNASSVNSLRWQRPDYVPLMIIMFAAFQVLGDYRSRGQLPYGAAG